MGWCPPWNLVLRLLSCDGEQYASAAAQHPEFGDKRKSPMLAACSMHGKVFSKIKISGSSYHHLVYEADTFLEGLCLGLVSDGCTAIV